MTPEAAIYRFFAGFGIPAYADTSVPDEAAYPYLTYSLVMGGWGDGEAPLEVNLWYRTDEEGGPNAKAREIHDAVGLGGAQLACDGGYIWLKRGSPWCQSMGDDSDSTVKRRYINITAEFLID